MAICMYDERDRDAREQCTAEYRTSPEFSSIEKEAAQRGYRKATIAEIHASAESLPFAVELFIWRGGLWVPNPSTAVPQRIDN